MGDSDLWRADGSFRGIQSSGSGGKGKGKGGGRGPQFTRVIPKFLQQYHQENPPEIQAKFAPPTMPGDAGEEEELDDVQKAAIAEFLEKDRAKTDAGTEVPATSSNDTDTKPKKASAQTVAGVGAAKSTQSKKGGEQLKTTTKTKRKRPEAATLSNKKLLSFSMDDDE